MDYETALRGSYKSLGSEALPSCATSTQLFANAPDGTVKVLLQLRNGGLTIRKDGNAATAQGNGIDYASGAYEFTFTHDQLKQFRAIQYGGTTTGWIAYLGLK